MRASIRAVCFWALAVAAFAGPVPGQVNGRVVDAQGAPAARAQVFCQTADGRAPRILRADARGAFHLGPLPDGLYDLRAESGGRWSEWQRNVLVIAGGQANITLRLIRVTPPAGPPKAPK